MPAFPAKIHGRWRVAHGRPTRVLLNRSGSPVDGGGYSSRLRALAQSRAINARQAGYPPRARRRRRRPNPAGSACLVWIAQGEVLELPEGKTHLEAVPRAIGKAPFVQGQRLQRSQLPAVNRLGYFRAVIVNDRMYVSVEDRAGPSQEILSNLRRYARSRPLRRGVIVERRGPGERFP